MFANMFCVQHRMFMDCFWVSTSKLVCQRIHPVSFVRMNFMTLWWEKEEWIMDPELIDLPDLLVTTSRGPSERHNFGAGWKGYLTHLDSCWISLGNSCHVLLQPAITAYHCTTVDGQKFTKYSNPATHTMLNPRTIPHPKSQCFSARVNKSDIRGLISFVHSGQRTSDYINIELWRRGGCIGHKGFEYVVHLRFQSYKWS